MKPFLCYLLLLSSSAFAQSGQHNQRKWSFGPQIGMYSLVTDVIPINCDSVVGQILNQDESQTFSGAFVEYIHKSLGVRAEFTFMHLIGISTLMYSQNQVYPGLGPDAKAISVRGYKIEVPITARLRLPGLLKPFQVFGGISSHFNNIDRNRIDLLGRNPGVEDVGNVFYKTYKKYTASYVFGIELDVWRLFLSARYQKSFGSVTNDIQVWGNRYSFATRQSYLHATLGYRFYSFRLKNKSKDLYKTR